MNEKELNLLIKKNRKLTQINLALIISFVCVSLFVYLSLPKRKIAKFYYVASYEHDFKWINQKEKDRLESERECLYSMQGGDVHLGEKDFDKYYYQLVGMTAKGGDSIIHYIE